MNPVSAAELAQIQSDAVAAVCDKTATIYRKTTVTSDGMGGQDPQYTQIASTVAGVAQPTGTQLQNFDFRIGALKAWQVHMPVGTDAQEQDHLIIEGKILVAQVILTPRSYPALLTVLASEVE